MSRCIHMAGWPIIDLGSVNLFRITRWRKCHSGRRWCPFNWRCTLTFVPPDSLQIPSGGIFARAPDIHFIYTNLSGMSFYSSLHHSTARNLNSQHLLMSDLSTRIYNQVLRYLYCGTWKHSSSHLAVFEVRHMADCARCTHLPQHAIATACVITYNKSVATSKTAIRLLPLAYTLL
jgi:hypothetical protein